METLLENFRTNIRMALKASGRKQVEIARLAGLHPVSLCKILSGDITPTIATCERIAEAVKIDPKKMFQKSSKWACIS